jgi:hypothetical protein
MGKLVKVLNGKLNEADETQKKPLQLVKDLKQAANQRDFIQKATEASATLSRLDRISSVVDAMNYGMITVDNKAGDLRVQIEQQTGELRGTAKTAEEKRKKIESPLYMPVSGAVAIIEYPLASPGAWIVGVAIDVVPFLMLLLLVLDAAEQRESEAEVKAERNILNLRKPAE